MAFVPRGSTKSIAKVQPLARGVKTDTKSVRKLGGIKKSRQLSVSKRIRQKFGSKKTKEVAKTDKGSKGPIPPVSAQHVSKTKTAQSQKSKKASKDGKTGPLPPSAAPHKLKPKKRGPPAARPLHFGPPGITPVVFFRTRRIARKERVLKHLKLRTKRRRVL
ncbi:hypothetical protein RB195_015263 [Necator americanus]|uniref:Uncharacterized protein n=1 Tax=Necator americanus TaxID=51031 RepID=A0ABR1E3R2_NECAM